MARFCTNCGSPVPEELAFCTKCGARQEAPPPASPTASALAPQPPTAAPAPVSAMPTPSVTPPPPAPQPAQSGNLFLKIVAIVLGVIALVTALAIGSCVYIGLRVKRKAVQMATDFKKEATKGHSESGDSKTVPSQPCPDIEPGQSQAFLAAASAASIPLKPGLTLVDVWTNESLKGREVEVLTTVQSVGGNTVTVNAVRAQAGSQASTRTLCIADLLNARQYETGFGSNRPTTITGATMFSMSQAVFQDWKAGNPAEFEYYDAYNGPANRIHLSADSKGTLSRVEPNDVPHTVIVNGERKDLPTLHVKGKLGDRDTEAYIYNDPANPITLEWNMPSWNFHIDYVKIDFPVEKKIEQDIAKTGCAAVYGIYFDFDSAKLRPESGPALKEIAEALKNNPAWKVTIEGHTDNVGGDAYNVTLSGRRAEAVKQTLEKQFLISTDRLSSSGFGASRPKGSNETAEGRALNRRVELCRR